MAGSRSVLQIVLDAVGFPKAGQQIIALSDGITELGEASERSAPKLTQLEALGTKLISAFAAKALFDFGREAVTMGLQADKASLSLQAYAGSAFEAERTTRLVQEAAGGAVSELDAMQNAAQLMAMGLATNAEEAANLTKVAITLGASMGRGPQESFNDFALLLANQSIPRLDTFGISSGRVRDRIQELQMANEGMSRETAFMTAVLDDAEDKMKALDEAGFVASNSIDVLSARFEDIKLNVGSAITDAILPAIDASLALAEANREEANQLALTDISYEDYITQLGRAGKLRVALTEAEFNAIRGTSLAAQEMENRGTPAAVGYAGALSDAAEAAGDVAEQSEIAALKIGELTTATLVSDAVKILNDEMRAAAAAGGDITAYQDAFVDLTTRHGILTDEQADLQVSLQNLHSAFQNDGITPAEQLVAAFDHLIERAETLQLLAQDPIRFQIFSDVGVGPGGTAGGGTPIGDAGGGFVGAP